MSISYRFDPSISAMMAVAVKPIATLHNVSGDVALSWITELIASPTVDRGQMVSPIRDGVATFHIGSSKNEVKVAVQVVRFMQIDNDDTWIGKHVCCKTEDWSWAYLIDWRTGNVAEQIELGKYPFSYLSPVQFAKV